MAREPFAAKLTTIWIGALFFWIINIFKGKYVNYLDNKFENRNLITGYLLIIGSIVVFVMKFVLGFF